MSQRTDSRRPAAPVRRGPTVDLDPSGQVDRARARPRRAPVPQLRLLQARPGLPPPGAIGAKDAQAEFAALVSGWSDREDFILPHATRSSACARTSTSCSGASASDPGCFQEMQAEINRTPLGGLPDAAVQLPLAAEALAVRQPHRPGSGRRSRVLPGEGKYLFVYPFVKTRAWYLLAAEERQGMMDEHITRRPRVPERRINTSYSFGLDDQEFVVAFETRLPAGLPGPGRGAARHRGERVHPARHADLHLPQGRHRGDPRAARLSRHAGWRPGGHHPPPPCDCLELHDRAAGDLAPSPARQWRR